MLKWGINDKQNHTIIKIIFFSLDNQQILDQGLLEDEQEFPVDDEIGQQNNITMKQRKGEMYPVIDKDLRTIDIPIVSGNPFGPDSDSEEEPLIDRYRGTDNYDDYVPQELDNVDMDREREVELEEDRLKEREESVRGSREEEDEGEEDENDELELDAVCYGDEHDAEPLALARKNDGVLVKNVSLLLDYRIDENKQSNQTVNYYIISDRTEAERQQS